MSIKTDAVVIRDETTTGANTATRVGTNLVNIADDLVAKQAAIDLNSAKETNINHPLVETAVPVGAVFTDNDTIYDDTAIQAEVDLNTAKVGITAQQASDITTNNAKVGVTVEEANPDVVSQVEAEAGVATDERIWTAQRVKQAIDALAGGGAGVDDTAYGISWDGVTGTAPSKNALYDFIESQVFKVDATSNIVPIFWGGTQAEYDVDFPSGHPTNYFVVITDGAVTPTTASDIVVDASGFSSNLSATDTDVQTALGTLDALVAGGTMTDAEVKIAYENNANTNAFTDAEKVVVGNTSGTNTGDQVPTTGTGTAIDLTNVVGAYYNIGASSTATAFTVPTVAVGGFAVVESASTTTEPTITVTGGTATEIPSLAWTASTLMYLNIYSYDGTNVFYYWSDTVSSISGTVAVAERNILNYEENFSTDSNYYQKWVEKENIGTGGDLGIGTFRIPTMAHFPNGDCVVAAEGRIGTANDFEVAVIFVSILRNGYTLSKQILRTPTAQENKVGSPNLVAVGSRMYLFYNSFSESGTPNLTNEIKLFYVYSDDSGVTWSAEVEILPDDQNSASTFKYLLSPGNSLVLANGKIMIPIWGKIVADTSPAYYRSGVLVWDVNGTGTFVKRLDNDTEGTAEPSIYIDKDGTTIVMDSRNSELTFRTVRTSIDEGVTWNTHPSNGYTAVAIFINIKRYADQLIKVEITDGANSSIRQNLNLYVGGLDNVSWNKVQDITERDDFIWGYGAVSYYAGELLVVSEDKPDLNLYKVNIEGSNMLNMFSLTPPDPPTPTLFDYTPVGTIIDINKWTVLNTDPSKVEITQVTDAIVFKDLITQTSGVASEKLSTDGLYSCNTAVGDVFVYFKITKTNDSFFQLNFNGGLTNNISFRTNANNSNFITLKRVQPTGVDTNTTETLDGEFKLSFVSGTLLVYKWNGSSYVQIISETYADLDFNIDLIRAVNTVLDETMSVNRITIRNEDWTGVSPVA